MNIPQLISTLRRVNVRLSTKDRLHAANNLEHYYNDRKKPWMTNDHEGPWYSFALLHDFLMRMTSGHWSWVKNGECKYINVRIDTRTGTWLVQDRDGNPISYDRLNWQYSKENPEPPREKSGNQE